MGMVGRVWRMRAVVALGGVVLAVGVSSCTGGPSRHPGSASQTSTTIQRVSLPSRASSGSTYLAPSPNVGLTPPGWSPVGLGSIQISVPSDWYIESPEGCPTDEDGPPSVPQ